MKLDYDLIRKILIDIEEKEGVWGYNKRPQISGYPDKQIYYTCKKMSEGGLIEISEHTISNGDPFGYDVSGMTFDGHNFLEVLRKDTFWSKTKEYFTKNGISLTIDAIKSAVPFVTKLIAGG